MLCDGRTDADGPKIDAEGLGMTLLSLIVPVYRVEEYLERCLDSIFAQAYTGRVAGELEVIAVDDASDDGSAKILAWYADRHPQLRVVSLDRNGGLGAARNVGIGRATGRYLWCVDSDDWLPDGTLAAVADRLLATAPDLLVTGYSRVYPDGRAEPHRVTAAGADLPDTFTFVEQPGLLDVLWIACNKVIRREFLAGTGLRFGPGWYEDVAFVVPVMLAAERISLLDRDCYAYRQRAAGAITQTVSDRHFEVFDQWRRVFEFMDGRPGEYDPLRVLIFQRMIWHCFQVLGHRSRVPSARRREFFATLTRQYHRYLPPGGCPAPPGNDGVKQRLVAVGAYRLFETLMTAWQVGGGLARIGRRPPAATPVGQVPARVR
ncbi:glycosyltransferase family 2 protein [Solwaraspora sp. WMMD1047]|uniref:glycosyltransferase family 2 protein n=1 Tax=Solwaraspora sp. WMMD1047 TaxID=3016102 RepID=UPI002416F2AD|nr:glycosyltransferase family 2 protein [Solwaraspora sp. WMMD1047]MDG4831302.1 glycosyltransferase family 2 protein [Solwaraspora sp. WMMD1047]